MKIFFQKFRFSFRLLKALWQKHQKLIIFSFLVGILSFWLLPKAAQLFFKKNVAIVGVVGKFTLNDLPLEIQHLIGQGLTTASEDDQIEPLLAASWETENGGKEYIFTLKDNLFWHDGKPVKAADIDYHFSDVTTTALDEKKIKFALQEPFSPFPLIVSRPVFKESLIGTGSYQVKKIKKNGQVVEKLILVSSQDKHQIVFRFYPTEQALRTAFRLGEINVLREISHPGSLMEWENLKIKQKVKYNRFVAVFFNTQNLKLADKSFRQALAYAIQKPWPHRAINPINPQSWVYNPGVKKYEYDLENARQLLGKTDGEGESLKEIELTTIPSLFSVAEEIKKDWQALGVETKIKAIASPQEDFEALLITQEIPQDPDQYLLWHSTQKTNISRYKSPKIDKLLEEGRKTSDFKERKEIYQDFQRFLAEDTPAVFLFHPVVYTVSTQEIVL